MSLFNPHFLMFAPGGEAFEHNFGLGGGGGGAGI